MAYFLVRYITQRERHESHSGHSSSLSERRIGERQTINCLNVFRACTTKVV